MMVILVVPVVKMTEIILLLLVLIIAIIVIYYAKNVSIQLVVGAGAIIVVSGIIYGMATTTASSDIPLPEEEE
jgi:hypothetical protein